MTRTVVLALSMTLVAGCMSSQPSGSEHSAAATAPPFRGPIPTHVMTYILWGADDEDWGLPGVDVKQAAKWLTWAMAAPQDATTLHNAGIKTMFYTNPNRVASFEGEYANDES